MDLPAFFDKGYEGNLYKEPNLSDTSSSDEDQSNNGKAENAELAVSIEQDDKQNKPKRKYTKRKKIPYKPPPKEIEDEEDQSNSSSCGDYGDDSAAIAADDDSKLTDKGSEYPKVFKTVKPSGLIGVHCEMSKNISIICNRDGKNEFYTIQIKDKSLQSSYSLKIREGIFNTAIKLKQDMKRPHQDVKKDSEYRESTSIKKPRTKQNYIFLSYNINDENLYVKFNKCTSQRLPKLMKSLNEQWNYVCDPEEVDSYWFALLDHVVLDKFLRFHHFQYDSFTTKTKVFHFNDQNEIDKMMETVIKRESKLVDQLKEFCTNNGNK